MEEKITYRDCTNEGTEVCRDLCNALMQHQAGKAHIYKELLGRMSYDTRLKPSFERSGEKYLVTAFDGDRPVGYICAMMDTVTDEDKKFRPAWTKEMRPEDGEGEGFYASDMKTPCRIGEIYNLYIMPEYRGLGISRNLMRGAMDWIKSHRDAEKIFVMVSNGNNAGSFYEKYGFREDHKVFGGIITSYSMDIR